MELTADQIAAVSAATMLINTFELLEDILLMLDLRTLLLAKRVSTRFRDAIDGSINIQKALFFKPISLPTATKIKIMVQHISMAKGVNDEQYAEHLPEIVSKVITLNPLLEKCLSYSRFTSASDWRGHAHPTIHVKTDPPGVIQKLHDSPPCASWRRMLVLQPHAAPMI